MLELAKPNNRVQACSRDGDAELRSKQQADWIGEKIDGGAHRVARRGWPPIWSHHVRAFSDSPDEQCLTKIAALLRHAFPGCKIDKAAEAEGRIHREPRSRISGCVEAELQQVIYEDARLFQVRVYVMQAVMHGSRSCCLDDFRRRDQHFLVHRQDLAVRILVRIIDR